MDVAKANQPVALRTLTQSKVPDFKSVRAAMQMMPAYPRTTGIAPKRHGLHDGQRRRQGAARIARQAKCIDHVHDSADPEPSQQAQPCRHIDRQRHVRWYT